MSFVVECGSGPLQAGQLAGNSCLILALTLMLTLTIPKPNAIWDAKLVEAFMWCGVKT